MVIDLEDVDQPPLRKDPRAFPIFETVLIAGLGVIALFGFSRITNGYLVSHCETQECTDRLRTGRAVLLVIAIVAPALAVALGLLARYGDRFWRWVMWAVFVVGLIAICGYGLYLATHDDIQDVSRGIFLDLGHPRVGGYTSDELRSGGWDALGEAQSVVRIPPRLDRT